MKKLKRKRMKKIYKQLKAQDAEVGRELSRLTSQYYNSKDELEKTSTKQEIAELKKERRFRDDCPSFASFKKVVSDGELSLKELEDSLETVD